MIKEGDILFFKGSDSFSLTRRKWKEGDICICTKLYLSPSLTTLTQFKIKNTINNQELHWKNDYEDWLYIHNWFYTISEWRDLQINKINIK